MFAGGTEGESSHSYWSQYIATGGNQFSGGLSGSFGIGSSRSGRFGQGGNSDAGEIHIESSSILFSSTEIPISMSQYLLFLRPVTNEKMVVTVQEEAGGATMEVHVAVTGSYQVLGDHHTLAPAKAQWSLMHKE